MIGETGLNTRIAAMIFGVSILLLAGCGGPVAIQTRGISPLNPGDNGSAPVKVRFYELKRDEKFKAATVESLWIDDKKVLGEDRVKDPVTADIEPGNKRDAPTKVDLGELNDSTKFIGVLALYRKAEAKDNRTLVIPVAEVEKVLLEFTGFTVAIAKDDDADKPKSSPPANSSNQSGSGPRK